MKVTSLVAGIVAGAESIDYMALLRHGGMGRIFIRANDLRRQIWSNDFQERLNREIGCRTDVVGIFPDSDA